MQMVLRLKKEGKIEKRGLTIVLGSGILTKLFGGDEAAESSGLKVQKSLKKVLDKACRA